MLVVYSSAKGKLVLPLDRHLQLKAILHKRFLHVVQSMPQAPRIPPPTNAVIVV
jgi:hypothetical protein